MNINLEGTIKKINMMNDNKEKLRLYNAFANYLYHLEKINKIDINKRSNLIDKIIDTDKINYKSDLLEMNCLDDMYANICKLNGLYRPILKKANNYPIYNDYYPHIPQNKGLAYLREFFEMMGNNVSKLFETLIKGKFVYEKTNYDKGGTCLYIHEGLSSIIVKENVPALYKMTALAHEMGHAYDNYLNKTADYKRYNQINCEITSMTFEQLFIQFLEEKKIFSNEELNMCKKNNLCNYLFIMNGAYFLNQISLNKDLTINEVIQLDDEDVIKYSILEGNLAYKYLCDTKFYDNYYAVGLIFASLFLNHFKKDAKSTIKEIENLSLLSQNLKTSEILNYYSKTDLINATNQNISKTFCKRY